MSEAENLLREAAPIDALETERYAPFRSSLLQALNLCAGFVTRYTAWDDTQRSKFHTALGSEPLAAFGREGVPEPLAGFLPLFAEAPQDVVQFFAEAPERKDKEILPVAAYWGVQALIRTPAGQRLVAQTAQRWAPSVLRWGRTGIGQAWDGIRTLNP